MENETTRRRVDDDIYLTPENLIEDKVIRNKSGELVPKTFNDPKKCKNSRLATKDLPSKHQKINTGNKGMSTRFWEWRCRKSVAVVIGLIIALFITMGIVVGCITFLGNGKFKRMHNNSNHYDKNPYLFMLDKPFLYSS